MPLESGWLNMNDNYARAMVNQLQSSLADIAYDVKNLGAYGDGNTHPLSSVFPTLVLAQMKYPHATDLSNEIDWCAIQGVINAIKTSETTENIPTQRVVRKLLIPGGIYLINKRIDCPSYVHIEGAGRHNTFLDSYITNGDPVINLNHNDSTTQQFYNTIEGFTINGRSQNCQGIKLTNVSRWILRDILINLTNYEGLYLDTSYLGEAYSVFLRGCGDATHNSLVATAAQSGYGANAVSFFGGEIAGGQYNGVYIKNSSHFSFNGTTIEGFTNGTGLIVDNCYALTARCYFEQNKQHIVEVSNTFGSIYDGSYFAVLQTGGLGHIGVYYAQGLSVQGCYFEGTSVKHVYDSTGNSTGKLRMSVIRGNTTQSYPINVDSSLMTDGQTTGTIIESFNGSFDNITYGRKLFNDRVTHNDKIYLTSTAQGATTDQIYHGSDGTLTISPASMAYFLQKIFIPQAYFYSIASSAASGNSIFLDSADSVIKFKDQFSTVYPFQLIRSGATASRPSAPVVGQRYFDTTLGKPIWCKTASPVAWVDATGATV